jgi:transcriptional regulator with XRE-family HTH domain
MKNRKNISGKRIRLARTRIEMSQSDLCAALSVDHGIEMNQNTISNIERGARVVKDYELGAFAAVLNVQPSFLLSGDNGQNGKLKKGQ